MTTEANLTTIEERYSSATNTRNLKVERDANVRNVADILIAAGWSRNRFGTALMRLQSEWDGCAKPRPLSAAAVKILALTFVKEQGPDGKVQVEAPGAEAAAKRREGKGGYERVVPFEAARRQASEWHLHELGLVFQRLKTLPEVRDMLMSWGSCQGMESSAVTAAAVIAWWLHHVCASCHGGRYELLPGTDTRSSRICKTCKGTGSTKVPFAADGAAMVAEIEVALHGATCSMGASMRNRSRASQGDS
jgi:hypothetical protein